MLTGVFFIIIPKIFYLFFQKLVKLKCSSPVSLIIEEYSSNVELKWDIVIKMKYFLRNVCFI